MGSVMTSLAVKHLNLNTGISIIRAKRGCHLMVQSALTFTTKIKDYNIMVHTLHIGGTIRTCQKFLIRHHQKQLASSLKLCKTKEEKNMVHKAIKRSDAKLKGGQRVKSHPDHMTEDVT